jgi:hypothetical protein
MVVAVKQSATGPSAAPGLHAGEHYPRTAGEFNAWFADENACYAYLERLRWPDGVTCPGCGEIGNLWHVSPRQLRCRTCRREVRVTAGTILEDTRLPLTVWFQAAWLVTNEKNGVSALSLQRALDLKRYETSWLLLHKLRRAMVRPGRSLLEGAIEIDETYLGAAVPGKRGRGALGKAIVAVAVEKGTTGKKSRRVASGRVRLARIPDCSASTLNAFVEEVAAPGSVIHTDAWGGYKQLEQLGFTHHVISQSASGDPAHVTMPHVHRVASLLKRWLLGTHQGGGKPRQLDAYLDEFVFRFNRRKSASRGLLFYRLLEQAVQIEHVTHDNIIAEKTPRPHTTRDLLDLTAEPDENDIPF